ncbi:reverse transcriptase domain-containing protein [Tanacetum coccineum]
MENSSAPTHSKTGAKTNGLVERANRSLGEGIKVRLDERSKDWIGELSHVLWSHHTMSKSSNGETLFSLTYGTDSVIPAKIGMPTLRTMEVDPTKNDEALEINLDLIEKKGNKHNSRSKKPKLKWKSITSSRVRDTSFKQVTRSYRKQRTSHAWKRANLEPKWKVTVQICRISSEKEQYKLKKGL